METPFLSFPPPLSLSLSFSSSANTHGTREYDDLLVVWRVSLRYAKCSATAVTPENARFPTDEFCIHAHTHTHTHARDLIGDSDRTISRIFQIRFSICRKENRRDWRIASPRRGNPRAERGGGNVTTRQRKRRLLRTSASGDYTAVNRNRRRAARSRGAR